MRNSPPLAGSDRVFYPDISAWRPRSHLPSWFVTCRPASSFGLFIDELGKFITSDNNYFYRPAIALIYVVFVLFFLRLRTFERHRRASEDVYLANALVLLQDAAIHDLDLKEKNLLLHWLRSSGSAGTGLLGNVVETVQKRRPDVYPRTASNASCVAGGVPCIAAFGRRGQAGSRSQSLSSGSSAACWSPRS